jgi:hypothetical protein
MSDGNFFAELKRRNVYKMAISRGDLKLDPTWDSLRGDPLFKKLVAFLAPKDAR